MTDDSSPSLPATEAPTTTTEPQLAEENPVTTTIVENDTQSSVVQRFRDSIIPRIDDWSVLRVVDGLVEFLSDKLDTLLSDELSECEISDADNRGPVDMIESAITECERLINKYGDALHVIPATQEISKRVEHYRAAMADPENTLSADRLSEVDDLELVIIQTQGSYDRHTDQRQNTRTNFDLCLADPNATVEDVVTSVGDDIDTLLNWHSLLVTARRQILRLLKEKKESTPDVLEVKKKAKKRLPNPQPMTGKAKSTKRTRHMTRRYPYHQT